MQIMGSYGMMRGSHWILWLILYILILIGVVLLIRYLHERWATEIEPESSLENLKKRYARGEINKEEFEEKKKDLI